MSKKRRVSVNSEDCAELPTSISSFNKREIFKHLNEFGCSEESLNTVLSRFKLPKAVAVDFLNELQRRSEKYIHQECSSFCFDNLEAWLEILKQNNWLCPLASFAEYINEMIETEDFPPISDINGIDLRAAYKFIANGLLGLPQPMINYETAEFLSNEMQTLIADVNKDDGDEAAYAMFFKLQEFNATNANLDPNQSIKLDPFGLE